MRTDGRSSSPRSTSSRTTWPQTASLARGTYSVWIGYTREQTTPPQAGFQRCDSKNQYTRWRESFEIIISSLAANPNPTEDPDPFGDLIRRPNKKPMVDPPRNDQRGRIAEHHCGDKRRSNLHWTSHPTDCCSASCNWLSYNVLDANAPLNPLTSIAVRDNLFLEQNLIAGSDFVVDPQKSNHRQSLSTEHIPEPDGEREDRE